MVIGCVALLHLHGLLILYFAFAYEEKKYEHGGLLTILIYAFSRANLEYEFLIFLHLLPSLLSLLVCSSQVVQPKFHDFRREMKRERGEDDTQVAKIFAYNQQPWIWQWYSGWSRR